MCWKCRTAYTTQMTLTASLPLETAAGDSLRHLLECLQVTDALIDRVVLCAQEQHVQAGTLPRRFVVPLEGIAAPYASKGVKAEPGGAAIGAKTNGDAQQADGAQEQTAAMDELPSGELRHQEAAAASPAKESAGDRKAHKKHHRRHHKHRSKEHKEKRRHKHQSPEGAAEDSAAQTEGAVHDDADSEVEPLASVTERVLSRFGLAGQGSAGKTARGSVMDRLGPSKVKRASG